MITNLKNTIKTKIKKNKLSIKSLKKIKNIAEVESEIKNLKRQNTELFKSYFADKRKVFSKNKEDVKLLTVAIKNNKKLLKENKRIVDQESYENLVNELKILKDRRRNVRNEKYRIIYGTSENKKPIDRMSNMFKFLIIIGLMILFMVPFWLLATYSTKNTGESINLDNWQAFKFSNNGGAEWNYKNAIEAMDIWSSLFTTLIITIISNLSIILLASMAAWQLVRYKGKVGQIIFSVFIVAILVPFQAIMVPIMSQFTKVGINQTIIGVSIAYIGIGMATSVFMLHGFLKTVPKSLEESALISGMSPFTIFIKIILPLLKTTFVTILILNIMWIWNDYLLPSLLLSDKYGPQTLQVKLISKLVTAAATDLKAMAAGVFVVLAPPIVFFIFAQKKMISGITNGAIK